MTGSELDVVRTARLLVRPPREADRDRFVELFRDEDFMVYAGVLTEEEARDRFDHMVAVCQAIPFGKQPVVAPENLASQSVCRNLGFTSWKQAPVAGDLRNLYTLPVGER